jgi:hypothetical protein
MSTMPGWVGPTMAISLVVIALAFVAIALVVLLGGKAAAKAARGVSEEIAELRRELAPTIQSINRLSDSVADLSGDARKEITAFLRLSRQLRRAIVRGVRRVRGRLEEADALYEVVSGEVEDTALDVAAKLRTLRSGASALSRIKRFLGRRR